MNDALYEQLVPRKQKTSGILISILIIVLAVAVAVLWNASWSVFCHFLSQF